MTIHPCLFPTIFVAGVSVAGAAILRRTVRKEYSSLLPYLIPWGVFCTIPALAFAVLCLPPLADIADQLNEAIAGTEIEILGGTAGVLPGLLWDEIDERLASNRVLPFRLPAEALHAIMIAMLLILVLLPYVFLFNRPSAAHKYMMIQPGHELAGQTGQTESPAPNP